MHRIHRAWILSAITAWLGFCLPASGSEAQEPLVLDEVLVSGELPGPAMWKVSKGDHTLWIMGTLSPMPTKMTWRQQRAEEVIQASGEILGNSTTDWDMDLGFREGIGLVRQVMRLRHNADGATLREVLPSPIYDRWHAAHRHWFGKDPSPKERARPAYAAILLYEQALKRSGLSDEAVVWATAERLARKNGVRVRERRFTLAVEDPRGLFDELARLPVETEAACLSQLMDHIERELPDMKRRAQAWAVGDVAALRALPRGEQRPACMALGHGTRLQQLANEQSARFSADWAGIVDWLLLTHETSFTTLPIGRLLESDGVLQQLRDRGYTVQEPH